MVPCHFFDCRLFECGGVVEVLERGLQINCALCVSYPRVFCLGWFSFGVAGICSCTLFVRVVVEEVLRKSVERKKGGARR